VITTPSLKILDAIRRSTLNDDVYGEDATTINFEKELAALCGLESAAFVLSGTMANQLALRALLLQPPHAILASHDSHIIHWEAGGIAHLSGAMIQSVKPSNNLYLTLEDIQKYAVVTDDIHKCPTRAISIENTSHGNIVPITELEGIKEWAEHRDIGVHIDGARLWEAMAAKGGLGSLKEFARCCDVLTLDFSKNLAAPLGAMVLGSTELIKRLKHFRKSIGGGMRQAGVLASAAREAVIENFGVNEHNPGGLLRHSHSLARRVANMWVARGGRVSRAVETNMVWLDLKAAGITTDEWNKIGEERGIRLSGKRIVLHHQICETAMKRLEIAMNHVLGGSVHDVQAASITQLPIKGRL
jgi:threonine aldolase